MASIGAMMNPKPKSKATTTSDEDENTGGSSCESEILRNRLLCNNTSFFGGSSGSNTLPLLNKIETVEMSGSGCYPKCNISLTMSANSEQLTVITTSVAAGGGVGGDGMKHGGVGGGGLGILGGHIPPPPPISTGGLGGGMTNNPSVISAVNSYSNSHSILSSNSSQSLLHIQSQPKEQLLPEIDIKPIIVGINQPSLNSSTGLIANNNVQNAPTVPVIEVKKEHPVLQISYDRDRILTFLTDYWKSKNLQQVTEAQQQTAGVSGVTSADFCPAPQRIVEEALFDLFVEYPMMIDGLAISKRSWAKAFYEKDIIQTSKVLFEALFSEQEMQQCTLNGKKGTPELSAIKMLAILRTAAWMKNKKQDPYSFNTNISSHNQFPTNEEREKIEKKVFTERRSQANRKLTKTGGSNDGPMSSPSSRDTTSPEAQNHGSPSNSTPTIKSESPASSSVTGGMGASPAGENRLSLSEDFRREHKAPLAKIPRLDLDTEIVKQLQMLYGDNPEGLISYLLPNTKAILIDGFLIPHEDWMKAFDETGSDIVKAAWTLFKVLFSRIEILNCTLNGKNGTRELCPVKKLAILRAITWMKENQGTSVDIFSFNVRRTEFNCFPSDEDKDKIETKVYTEKRYQACRKLKGQLM